MVCDAKNVCLALDNVLVAYGNGLYKLELLNIKTGEVEFLGVAHKKRKSDRGLLINHCPFCGQTPGNFLEYKNTDAPKP